MNDEIRKTLLKRIDNAISELLAIRAEFYERLPKQTCPICLCEFTPTRTDQIVCSNACRQAKHHGRTRERCRR